MPKRKSPDPPPRSKARNPTPKKRTPRVLPSSGDWIPAFLITLRDTGNVRLSCSQAGIHRSVAYDRKASDPPFAVAWEEAHEESIDTLDAIARQRAMGGSDLLLIFLLKAHRRAVYGERIEVTKRESVNLVIVEEIVGD